MPFKKNCQRGWRIWKYKKIKGDNNELKSTKPYIFLELDKDNNKINIDSNNIEDTYFYLMLSEYINYYTKINQKRIAEVTAGLVNTSLKIDYDYEE